MVKGSDGKNGEARMVETAGIRGKPKLGGLKIDTE